METDDHITIFFLQMFSSPRSNIHLLPQTACPCAAYGKWSSRRPLSRSIGGAAAHASPPHPLCYLRHAPAAPTILLNLLRHQNFYVSQSAPPQPESVNLRLPTTNGVPAQQGRRSNNANVHINIYFHCRKFIFSMLYRRWENSRVVMDHLVHPLATRLPSTCDVSPVSPAPRRRLSRSPLSSGSGLRMGLLLESTDLKKFSVGEIAIGKKDK